MSDAKRPDLEQLARRVFAAYPAGDRDTLEEILAEDFHFTSPYDDAIDRTEYFSRCWPNHDRMRAIRIHRVVVDGDTAFVTYELVTKDDRHIHNAEVLTFRDDKLVSVFVHFGAERDANGGFLPMQRPTA
jgi:ketosteroid isomerase-like protein